MHLYALTLQKASTINHAIHGNFSGSKQQEIVISRGKIIELLRPDPNTGKVFPLLAMEMFGVIRDLIAFRLTGGSKGKYWYIIAFQKLISKPVFSREMFTLVLFLLYWSEDFSHVNTVTNLGKWQQNQK